MYSVIARLAITLKWHKGTWQIHGGHDGYCDTSMPRGSLPQNHIASAYFLALQLGWPLWETECWSGWPFSKTVKQSLFKEG